MKKNPYCKSIAFLVCISFTALLTDNAKAVNTQIQTDKTLQGITARNVDAPGNNQVYTLSEIHGKTAGNNLFYSFSNFNIGATDSAWFKLNTPDLTNVISRVTGGSESFIEGALKMTNDGSTPAFFFINPAGITFGAGASVDVPSAFYTSTASALNLDDGSQYLSNETDVSTLSAADPESFGFLRDESGKINIGSLDTARTNLTFKPGTDAGLVANQIQIHNATVANADTSQDGINLQIVATGDEAAQIKLGTLVEDQTTAGDLDIRNSRIDASGNAGSIEVRANSVKLINGSAIIVKASSQGDAGYVDVKATERLIINNGRIRARALDSSKGEFSGFVRVIADTVELTNDGKINSSTSGAGDAGSVVIQARKIDVIGSNITSNADAGSSGNAGEIIVVGVESKVQEGIDSAGDIKELIRNRPTDESFGSELTEVEMLNITGKGVISSSTSGSGDAGSILIQAKQIEIDHSEINSEAKKIEAKFGSSKNIGSIKINAVENIILSNNAKISIENSASPSNDLLLADKSLLSLSPGSIVIEATNLSLTGSKITANSIGNADAGKINIKLKNELYLHPSVNRTTAEVGRNAGPSSEISTVASSGNGGAITISGATEGKKNFELFRLYNSTVKTSVSDPNGKGNGGNITVKANNLVMNNGFIQANTAAVDASGGDIIGNKVLALVPSNDFLLVGGEAADFLPFAGRNVIQAAAPNGESGNPIIGIPQLNLSGVLTDLTIEPFDTNAMNRNMCTVDEGSSLLPSGKGGMRMRARDFLLSPIP